MNLTQSEDFSDPSPSRSQFKNLQIFKHWFNTYFGSPVGAFFGIEMG